MISTARPAPAESPSSSATRAEVSPGRRNLPPWKPGAEDHLIYQWVRFDGKRQTWVAAQLGISQATVSRVLQRFDRWKAHAEPRDGGELDPAERARAQRWLTYERNELIIASALRLADEMEGFTDTSKTVTSHPLSQPTQESVVRRESNMIDRSGMVSRFLRLAHRVNMDQLKLVELPQPPRPEPLSDDEIARQAAEAAADRQERRDAKDAAEAHIEESFRKDLEVNGDAEALEQYEQHCAEAAARKAAERAAEDAAEMEQIETSGPRLAVVGSACRAEPEPAKECEGARVRECVGLGVMGFALHDAADSHTRTPSYPDTSCQEEPAFMHAMNRMHNADGEKTAASDDALAPCAENGQEADFWEEPCMGGSAAAGCCISNLDWPSPSDNDERLCRTST